MLTEQKYFNEQAKSIGERLSDADRKLLKTKYGVDDSYLSHLFSGTRKAIRGKAAQIMGTAKQLADINALKASL